LPQPLREIIKKLKKELDRIDPDSSYLEAEILLSLVLNVEREEIYTIDFIDEEQEKKLDYLLKKRLKGIPISYLQKKKYFYDLVLYVDEKVFIPRPETEILLEKAIEIIEKRKINSLLEVGVGSGNNIIPIALRFPDLKIYAIDISPHAIKIAINNAKEYNVYEKISFFIGPYIFPILLRNIHLDMIIMNPPYISSDEIVWLSNEVKREPWNALYGGFDGCNFYRELFRELKLLNHFYIVFEISPLIYKKILKIIDYYFRDFKILKLITHKDLSEKERVIELECQRL